MRKTTVSILMASLLLGSTAFAGSFSVVEYVTVSKSSPISSTINEQVPVEKCSDVQEKVSNGGIGEHGDIIGAVAGGALGGVLGHQIGGGRGKTVATVGGAVLGTIAGQRVGSTYSTPSSDTYQTVRRCEVVNTIQTRQVISGYTNTARFKGQTISVESDQPMKQIPVTITYSY